MRPTRATRRNVPARPAHVAYEAPGFGVGELWLQGARVLHSELPRPRHDSATPPSLFRVADTSLTRVGPQSDQRNGPARALVARLQAFFAGEGDDFADVKLALPDGFHRACARALRAVRSGEIVTYGELAALAGHPGAARAAGTFCARCDLSPFVPTHRVVAAGGIGGYGDLGADYKRRLLALEGVSL